MPIVQINTPNLVSDLATISTTVDSIESNQPLSFDTFIDSCFALKPTQDCSAIRLVDSTKYQQLANINLDDITINYSVTYGKGGCSEAIVCSGTMSPNEMITLEGVDKDGFYNAEIQVTYTTDPGTPTEVVYTNIIDESYFKDCCTELFGTLVSTMKSKMATIGCTISKYSKIGRNVIKLKDSYLRISNLKWVYDNSFESCGEYEKVFCLYNKIK